MRQGCEGQQHCPGESWPYSENLAGHAEGDPRGRLAAAEQRVAELEEAVAARDQFIAVIGHEMRNPMVPILLGVDHARRMAAANDPGRLVHSLERLDLAVQDFIRRAVLLLDASRFNAGQFRLSPEAIDVSALIRRVAEGHAEMARHSGCAIATDVPPGVHAMLDPAALQQVLENVLSNALKYGAGRPVEMMLTASGPDLMLAVRDHGPGIADIDKRRIFERFERVARRSGPGGFGIGLWLVGQLVAAMGGTVTIDSMPGAGSTFTVRLPAWKNAET